MRRIHYILILSIFFAIGIQPLSAATLATKGVSKVTIVTAQDASAAERTAAQELADYLGKVTGGTFRIVSEASTVTGACLYVGPTVYARKKGLNPATWREEQWVLRSFGNDFVLAGGRPRGTLYAVYRFLEDKIGIRWWNAFEEYVPKQPTLDVSSVNRSGEPALHYRHIYQLYAQDGGRFAVRNRLNGLKLNNSLGGGVYYGPPGSAHTFYLYVPPEKYFNQHPEWFSLIDGKRTADNGQLCLTNPDLRDHMVEKLTQYIKQSRAEAQKSGYDPPLDFDISQNDHQGMCQCNACQAIAQREGSEAGPLIDFLNYIAAAIHPHYPDIRINTLAYSMTEDPPKTLLPHENVLPRLCDTNANLLRPITHADNLEFAERLDRWSQISKQLRIWDYAVAFRSYPGLPLPTVHTYAPDYRYYAEHNVQGVFTEHEFPITADLRDLKIWMMTKLLEEPYRNVDALLKDFTDGFYGSAGQYIRRYLEKLQAAAEAVNAEVNWFPALTQYSYLTLDFLRSAQSIFDQAEASVRNNGALLRRVRHARLPIDRACLVFWSQLKRQWARANGQPLEIPLDRDEIADRCRETWLTQIDLRLSGTQWSEAVAEVDAELSPLLAWPAVVPLPEPFKDLPPKDVFDFTADMSSNSKNQAERILDAEADTGYTNRLELSDDDMQTYRLPMPWGAYAPEGKQYLASAEIQPEDVPGPGYNWYKLPPITIPATTRIYFFRSWSIIFRIDSAGDSSQPDKKYEVWASIKFEGPGFPHGRANQKNAICVERVVVVAVDSEPDDITIRPPEGGIEFPADASSNWEDLAKRVADADAETGRTNRLELSDDDMQTYKLPMPWGAYAPEGKQYLASAEIQPEDVPGPEYNWYKLPPITIPATTRIYFFRSWNIIFRIDSAGDSSQPDKKYEVWASIKFEGPGFPHGQANQKNAICVERVVVVPVSN